ncbi:MAG: prepilin peptidase [Candidatus Parcubacteria bacterium]|nr:prepilin peptidase [Candidatus Parcubacteria bacterium]
MGLELIIFFILGLIFGSFINSLVYRLKNNLSLWERSYCPKCKQVLKYADLIPFLSFIFLGGKCRFCHKQISWQYPLVELITGILFALIFLKNGTLNFALFCDLFFVLVLIFIFVFDLKYYLILDKIIWPALIVGLIMNLLIGLNWLDLILGLGLGAGFFLLQYLVSNAKWVGLGDVKLGALIGIMLGWKLTLLTIVIAYLIGGLTAIILLIGKQKKFGDVLPMGTFLSLATIIVLLWGSVILSFYF